MHTQIPSHASRSYPGFLTAVACILSIAAPAFAQTAPPMGLALPRFGVLGGAAVTGSTTAGTDVNGDVGSSPTSTITNFPPSEALLPFIVHFVNDAVVQQAHQDAIAAYDDLFTQGTSGGVTPLGPQLHTQVLGPGVYRFAVDADLQVNGVLELNDPTGTGIFIFSVGTALNFHVGSDVIGTANPCNVYWQVGSSAVLDGDTFYGTVIADQSVTVASSNNLAGRAIAINGAVTMPGAGGNLIGGCSSAAVIPPDPPAVSCPPPGMTIGGVSGTGTVTLSAPAPPGGTVVTLTSSAPTSATVPPFVIVPGGATSVTFTITPGTVPGSVTITATTIGGSSTCTFLVSALAAAAAGSTLDTVGMTILLLMLAAAGVFAVNRFTS